MTDEAGVHDGFALSRLRRWPDAEAPNLFASDAADRLILDTSAPWLAATPLTAVAVIGDSYGALTLATASAPARMRRECAIEGEESAFSAHSSKPVVGIRVHQDSAVGERALAANAERMLAPGPRPAYRSLPLGTELVADARLVLLRLPKSLEALDEIAATVAAGASDEVVVVAGGMQKHLSATMNEVLGRYFARVDVGHGRQKARVLTVRRPRREGAAAALGGWPRRERHEGVVPADGAEAGLWACAHGGAFAGTRVDIGTRLLLRHLGEAAPDARTAVDLACGTGVLAAALALSRPGLQVIATDVSAAAAASARATAAANGVADRVLVRQESAGEGIRAGWADLVVLNPPFHTGAALDLRVGRMLVAAAARLLAPGGELWTVYNSHLDYWPALHRVGPTRQVDRNAKFTVTASVRR